MTGAFTWLRLGMRWGSSCLGRPLFTLPGIIPVPTHSSWVDSRLLQPFYPSSQAFLSPRQSTPGLGNPVCGLTRSLPRASVHPCNLHFPPRPLPLAQVLTQCFSYCATQLCASFLTDFVVSESFCQFPVRFPWGLFQIYLYFWRVYGGMWVPHSLTLSSWIPFCCFFF